MPEINQFTELISVVGELCFAEQTAFLKISMSPTSFLGIGFACLILAKTSSVQGATVTGFMHTRKIRDFEWTAGDELGAGRG